MNNKIKITFLGTGTSQGVPVIGCKCDVCLSNDKKNKRLRSSILVESEDACFSIDAGPDFRYQMLRQNVDDIDGIVITHSHKDHIAGLDDVRAFNWLRKKDMNIYASTEDQKVIMKEFSYAFGENLYLGVPQFNLIEIDEEPFKINNTIITPLKALHQEMEVRGFRIGDFAYITDTHYIPPSTLAQISDCKTVVLSAVRRTPHPSHFSLGEAIKMLEFIQPQKGIITHLSHLMGKYDEVSLELPDFVELAWDGMSVECRM